MIGGKDHLGTPPDDLFNVLALAASAAPATAAMRAYARASRTDPATCLPLRDIAARSGRAFLTLFNHAEVIEAVRTEFRGEPYWERVLEYAHAGGLQAVLDEYTHLLRESLSVAALPAAAIAEKLGTELIAALTIRAASLRIDEVTAPRYAREVNLKTEPMRIRFAMRFGDDRSDEEALLVFDGASPATRKERVRAAFNSPFWLFVLVSTSVGQEGLDFHHYCHAVTHWNLPSNPVDLEQREGRIHRYKGHAVRKNVAAAFAADALRDSDSDAWETAFDLSRSARSIQENDLVPYWQLIETNTGNITAVRKKSTVHSRNRLPKNRSKFRDERDEHTRRKKDGRGSVPIFQTRTASNRLRQASDINRLSAGRDSLQPDTPWSVNSSTTCQPRRVAYSRNSASCISGS